MLANSCRIAGKMALVALVDRTTIVRRLTELPGAPNCRSALDARLCTQP
jgi:hypothetical protein